MATKLGIFLGMLLLLWLVSAKAVKVLLIPENYGSSLVMFNRLGEVLIPHGNEATMIVANTVKVPSSVKNGAVKLDYFRLDRKPLLETKEHRDKAIAVALNGSISDNYELSEEEVAVFHGDCEGMLQDRALLKRLETERFDIAIVSLAFCGAAVALKLNIPFGYMGDNCFSAVLRIPEVPSYVPRFWHPITFTDKMTFTQRVVNFFLFWQDEYLTEVSRDDLIQKYVPEKAHIDSLELYRQGLLCFNIKPGLLDAVKPINPNIIPVGDMLARPANPLPADLEKFVNEAEHGVIIVCFGSWLTSLPYDIAQRMFKAFSQVKQRVIWKYHGQIPDDASSNILTTDWLPQNDLLGHPKTKLIIYHGGIGGLIESIYHGVPVIGLPLFMDQYQNIAMTERYGYGILLNIKTVNTEDLLGAINKVLQDPSYKRKIMESRDILRNPLASAGKTADYWLKHVVKYGGKHIRPHGMDMSFIAYHSLDVIACFFLVFLLMVFILYRFIKLLTTCICGFIKGNTNAKCKTS